MSVKGMGAQRVGGDVIRTGMLKKLKTSRKKFFVLRAETSESSARLEYYDSEKKFNAGQPPKRSIQLKTCFNINKRHDTKHKNVIALYTKDDCFCVVLDSEDELESWLKALLSLQHGEEVQDGETPRPTFEHVWQVTILSRGLGTGRTGDYRLCLTDKTLCLVKKDCNNTTINLNLSNIRSCGSLKNYFFLEIGRSSALGPGELWMDSEDTTIAQNIHTTIYHAMTTSKNDEPRNRTFSANEISKPINNSYRKQVISGISKATTHIFSNPGRERCDSMPSRPRDNTHSLSTWKPYLTPNRSYGRDISHSPPSGSPISPPSVGCSTDSAGSSYSLTDEADMMECPDAGRYSSIPLTPDEAIAEEDCPDSPCELYHSYVPMAPQSSDDGYVDMSPRSHQGHMHQTHSPTASLSSVVSGTPSTDIRFSDYPLDKVASYLTSEDDDTRPARAYSFGSKPDSYRGKKQIDVTDNSRVRAFSVGSKTKRGPTRIFSHQQHPSSKSSSAPILRTHSSHSSIDPMDDLMEMDFSRGSTNGLNNNEDSHSTNNGYVEMKPGVEITRKKPEDSPYVDMSGSSYMDMSGSSPSSRQEEECTSFVDVARQYKLHTNNNYMDMDGRKNRAKQSISPAWSNEYYDMSGSHHRRSERGSSFSSQLSNSSSPRNPDYLSMNFSPQENTKTPDGYVEMSIGKKHHRQGSLDGNQAPGTSEDYLNMSVGSKKKTSKGQKVMSQPISIHPTTNNSQLTKNSSPISISSLLGRKSSTGTPPKMHLPLSSWATASPYSSLPRQRTRKDSKDSSSSSVTTPSSSSTIFPMSLNSPSSPMKVSKAETPVPKFSSSSILGTLYRCKEKPAVSDDYAMMDFDRERDKENSDYVNYSPADERLERRQNSDDYAVMQPGPVSRSGSLDTSPLIGHLSLIGIKESQSMCFQPIKEDCVSSPIEEKKRIGDASDYMELTTPANNECVSPAAKISRPNSVNSDKPAPLARCTSSSSDTSRSAASRPSSTSSELWSSSSTLVNSRPESVNSDKKDDEIVVAGTNKLHYASLDLTAQEEDDCRSPRCPNEMAAGVEGLPPPTFVYAEIDFVKSEGLKHNGNQSLGSTSTSGTNAKIKN